MEEGRDQVDFGQVWGFFGLFFRSAQNLTYEIIRPIHPPNKNCPFIGWFARHSSAPQHFVSVGPFVTWRQEICTEQNAVSYNNCNDTRWQRWSTAVSVRSLTSNKSIALKQGVCECVWARHDSPPQIFHLHTAVPCKVLHPQLILRLRIQENVKLV